MGTKVSEKPSKTLMFSAITIGCVVGTATIIYGFSQANPPKQETSIVANKQPQVKKVTALGRIEPKTRIIKLFAPLPLDSDRVGELLVDEGDKVKKGQVLGILDSRDRLASIVRQQEEEVAVAQVRLDQVKAGAKTGEIKAQQATIRQIEAQWFGDRKTQEATIQRLEAQLEGEMRGQKATIEKLQAQLNNAKAEYQRYAQLYHQGATSQSVYDNKQLEVETTEKQLQEVQVNLARIQETGGRELQEARASLQRIEQTSNQQMQEAKSTLASIAEVRPVDVQLAMAEEKKAQAALEKAKTDLEQAYIRAPITGQILKVYTRKGEKIEDDGLLEIAQTQEMEAVAEVYQTDIVNIKVGQKATVTGEAFSGSLQGVVRQVGLQVDRQNVFSNQPGENLDRKIVEVRISLDRKESKKVEGLTNVQVQVAIEY